MKKLYVLFFMLWAFCSCQDDESVLEITMPQKDISFRPIPGGAIMHYKLPAQSNVFNIRVRYTDAQGKDILLSGSYACDSLQIIGFNEARQGVKAYVSLCDQNYMESEPVEVTFDTKDSGPVAFFDHLEVTPNWNGFKMSYKTPEESSGMVHVLYIGNNPDSKKLDTLLMTSFLISEGSGTRLFRLQSEATANTVIVRTEDFRGYTVKEKVWKDVESYLTNKLDPSQFKFQDPCRLSLEDPVAEVGAKYLFDGDTKGEICYRLDYTYKTFLAGPECIGKHFIIDHGEPRMTAQLRLYGMLYIERYFPSHEWEHPFYASAWLGYYYNKLPCNVTVFASNDKESWTEIGSFAQDKGLSNDQRWSARCSGGNTNYRILKLNEIALAEPAYMAINLVADGKKYRYLKLVINDIFEKVGLYHQPNVKNFLTFHELEVYTKKD